MSVFCTLFFTAHQQCTVKLVCKCHLKVCYAHFISKSAVKSFEKAVEKYLLRNYCPDMSKLISTTSVGSLTLKRLTINLVVRSNNFLIDLPIQEKICSSLTSNYCLPQKFKGCRCGGLQCHVISQWPKTS